MRRLRIAYVPAALRPGGAERQMLALAERLPRDQFDVDFLVLSGPGEYDARGVAAGARVRHIGSSPSPAAGLPKRILRRTSKTTAFIRGARTGHYDIVDAWLYPSDVLAALTKPLTRTPVVVSGRRNLDPHDQFGPAGALVDRLALGLTDVVVANSGAAAEYAIANEPLDPRKVRVIRNGVDPIPVLESGELASRRRDLGVTDDQLAIGCVANYHPVKRHVELIEAFASIAPIVPDARLILVGEGPQRPAMETRVRDLGLGDRVRLYGSVLDTGSMWGAFDIVVQASRSEGLPNALLEAASAGRPIVATAAGGTGEIVIDGVTGLLVPIDDDEALGSALVRLLGDAGLRARVGAAAREHARVAFGMDRFAAEFADLYLEIAAARGLFG